MIDSQRAAVYAAESAAFDGTDLESVRPVEVIRRRIVSVSEGEWWPGPIVTFRLARADATSSNTRCPSSGENPAVISIATSQMTVATAAHELAHALAGVASGHDATFRAAFIDVVAVMTNADSVTRRGDLHVRQLGEAFTAAGLPIGHRRWPGPPESLAGSIAL